MRATLGVSGSLCLMGGVFLPVTSVPLGSQLDYFQGGSGDGLWVLIAALLAQLLVVFRFYRWLLLPLLCSTLVIARSLYNIWAHREQLRAMAERGGESDSLLRLSTMLADAVQLHWGGLVLVLGLVLLALSAFWPERDAVQNAPKPAPLEST